MSSKTKKTTKTTKKATKKKEKTEKIKVPTPEEMFEAGVHLGHRISKWNPKMAPYIFTSRNNIHIIDLEKTAEKLKEAVKFVKELKKKKGVILFVGTKPIAKKIVEEAAKECKMPYVNERWLGGTLTNFPVISQRLEHFRELEKKKQSGELEKYTKKEQHLFEIELQKLQEKFGGLKEMTALPDALLILDIKRDSLAIKEAQRKGIPVIGICDTNTDPTTVDYPIPANDDSSTSLKLILEPIIKILKEK